MAILYVETNFPVGISKGQFPEDEVDGLFGAAALPNRLTIPSPCLMEALSALEGTRRRFARFDRMLSRQINQVRRDRTSAHAVALLGHLRGARAENTSLMNDIDRRLSHALGRLSDAAELIPVTPIILGASLAEALIPEPTDNLILHAILDHARSHPDTPRGFLSGNAKDFDLPDARTALGAAEVKYFAKIRDALGWLASLPTA